MNFTELHDELRSVAAGLLARDNVDWPLLAQAGWVGLEVPEDFGGAGATFAEVAVICGEIGRAAAPTGYLGGAVLGVGALLAVQSGELRDDLLARAVSGQTRIALALSADSTDAPFTVTSAGELIGYATFVPDAAAAQQLLLPTVDTDGGAALVSVDAAALAVQPQPVLDETRRLATVRATNVAVEEGALWRFDGDPHNRLRRLRDRAALAVACDSLGVAQAMLDATVSYVGVREQFGHPIGSFQAVKHACADMLVRISVASQLVTAAVNATDQDAPVAISMAKSYAGETAVEVAGKAMQLHGGIGYTWESGVHVYLKRAALNRSLFGSPAALRADLAKRYHPGS